MKLRPQFPAREPGQTIGTLNLTLPNHMPGTTKPTLPVVALTHESDELCNAVWTGERTQLMPVAIREGGEIGGGAQVGHDPLVDFVAAIAVAKNGDVENEVAGGDVRRARDQGRHRRGGQGA